MSRSRWFAETLHDGVRLSFEARAILHERRTDHQHLALIDNAAFGSVLLLDEVAQVTTADEFIYHEMMAHVPLLAHGVARDVLVVGGGDCGLARQVLRHETVERLVQVEIDPSVVDFAREHMPQLNAGVFDDPRFDLVIGDGAHFVVDTSERFDVVLVDSTDPIGPGAALFAEPFYRGVRRRLKPGGIMVSQNGVPFLQRREFVSAVAGLSAVFPVVTAYVIAVPTYFGGHMALGWSSDGDATLGVAPDELAARFDAAGIETRYYTPAVHAAAFALPRYIADALAEGRA